MPEDIQRRAFLATLAGVAALAVALIMQTVLGPVPEPATIPNEPGFKTTMMWIELAGNPEEVFANLGEFSEEPGQSRRRVLDRVNHADFVFLTAYSLFMGGLVWLVNGLCEVRPKSFAKTRVFLLLGVVCIFLMFIGDIIENLQLLDLTTYEEESEVSTTTLARLQLWTRVKWGALFAVSILLASGYFDHFRFHGGAAIALLYVAAACVGSVAISVTTFRNLIEPASAYLLASAWALSLVHAAVVWVKSRGEAKGDGAAL